MKRSSLSLFAAAFCGFVCNPSFAVETVIRYPVALERNLNTVCWTGTQFVAAGDYGVVQTSPDGIVWTPQELPGAPHILCSAAGQGRILLGGGTSLLTSVDGAVWTPASLPESANSGPVGAVAFNGSAFRAVARPSKDTWGSTDGLSWTKAPSGAQSNLDVRRMAVQDGKFIAWRFLGSGTGPQVLLREDGSRWASVSTDLEQPMNDLAWAGSRYIAVGAAGYAGTSVDGAVWTLRTTEVAAAMAQMIWTDSLAVAVGMGGNVITSPNGATWTARTSGTTAQLTSIAWSGSSMVAVGKGGCIIRSTDGVSWSVVKEGASLIDVKTVAWTGASAVAVGPAGTLISTDEGVTWTRTAATTGPTGASGQSLRIAAGPAGIVAADGSTGLWHAPPDASSWIKTSPAGYGGNAVVWDGHQFVALMQRKLPGWKIYATRSEDGIIWIAPQVLNSAAFVESASDPIIYDDLLFTGSSFLSGGLRSTDGVTWTAAPVPQGAFLSKTSSGGVVAVTPSGRLHTSPDGTTWTDHGGSSPVSMKLANGAIWTGSNAVIVFWQGGVFAGGPGSPWINIDTRPGINIAWTGTRAIVSDGVGIRTLEDVDSGLPVTWPRYLQSHFSTEEVADPAVGGPLADPDHDEFTNAVEYMFGTSPVSYAEAPVLTLLPAEGTAGPRLQWRQDTGRPGISVQAEVSYDLDVWDIIPIAPIDGTAGGMRTMQATAPLVGGKGYIRLHVTLSGS